MGYSKIFLDLFIISNMNILMRNDEIVIKGRKIPNNINVYKKFSFKLFFIGRLKQYGVFS